MKGIAGNLVWKVVVALISLSVGARAETISLNHSIKNKNAIVRATTKTRVSVVSVGVDAKYTEEYLSRLKSGRKWPVSRSSHEQPISYDFKSKITLHPSDEIMVTHTNDVLMDNHFRETTEISHQSNMFETDMDSAIRMSYDSILAETIFETHSTINLSFTDFGYTTKNWEPTTVFLSESFTSNFGQVYLQYIPTLKYDIEDNNHYFSNIIDVETQFGIFDVELWSKELFKKKSGSFYSRKLNVSYGYTSFGVVSREMGQELWRNGHTVFLKNRLDFGSGSPDVSVKTSYGLATNSDEKKIYIELVWGLKDGLFP
ncbi:hypothetical protein [Desulfopila aestuarii]|uniref:Uncharacterized protein n=1 Tax=Desulfopila aestuarii DSM 18488 TaxID=1121416 RepID=A0A1M7YBG4_9BACT|nr:hypothetical protein [Desulfopila aestuarii]SHO49896.1 hypothetical protein SAMN02745220_03140 [Desulfopila aestuarii DSM 18488]